MIRLTDAASSKPILVNPAQIQSVLMKESEGDAEDGIIIYCSGIPIAFYVRETMDDVACLIEGVCVHCGEPATVKYGVRSMYCTEACHSLDFCNRHKEKKENVLA